MPKFHIESKTTMMEINDDTYRGQVKDQTRPQVIVDEAIGHAHGLRIVDNASLVVLSVCQVRNGKVVREETRAIRRQKEDEDACHVLSFTLVNSWDV